MNIFKEDVNAMTSSDLLTELIYVRLENIRLKEKIQRDRKEAVISAIKDLVLFGVWAVVMLTIW